VSKTLHASLQALRDQGVPFRRIDTLKPWPKNPRNPEQGAPRLAKVIKRYGWTKPIVVRSADGMICAGHTAVLAAQALGLTEVPAITRDFTEAEAEEYAIADNRAPEWSGWHRTKLHDVLVGLDASTRAVIGWNGPQFQELRVEVLGPGAAGNRDEGKRTPHEDETPAEAPERVKEGEAWDLGAHRLVCGDNTDDDVIRRLLGKDPVAMVCTDPPYAIYGSSTGIGPDIADDKMVRPFFAGLAKRVEALLPKFGHGYVHTDWRSWAALVDGVKRTKQLTVRNCIVWDKGGGLGTMYAQCHEFVAFLVKAPPPKAMKGGMERGHRMVPRPNIARISRPTGDERMHNAAKPVGLLAELIGNSSDEGGIVVDLYGGSGSTLIACEKTKRAARVTEIQPRECDKILLRWERLTGEKARRRR